LRNLPRASALSCAVWHPGAAAARPLATTTEAGGLDLQVPLQHGCALVLLQPR
jgi:hypothetical protein